MTSSREKFLSEAIMYAEFNDPMRLSVRTLISQWSALGRGSRIVDRIRTDLRRNGLTSEPDFRQVALDQYVKLVKLRPNVSTPGPRPTPSEVSPTDEEQEMAFRLTVGALPTSGGGVESVSPQASLHEAYTRMLIKDFSQLAVLAGRTLKGAVTWRSIAEALLRNPMASLVDALIEPVAVRYSEDLLKLVPAIAASDFVFVRDQENRISGIVTSADLSVLFAERTNVFFSLGEIDERLRAVIARNFKLEEISKVCRPEAELKAFASFDELGMGDYQRVLEHPDRFARLKWPIDRATFIHAFDRAREVRNDVMHFNPDPIDDNRLAAVAGLLSILRSFA